MTVRLIRMRDYSFAIGSICVSLTSRVGYLNSCAVVTIMWTRRRRHHHCDDLYIHMCTIRILLVDKLLRHVRSRFPLTDNSDGLFVIVFSLCFSLPLALITRQCPALYFFFCQFEYATSINQSILRFYNLYTRNTFDITINWSLTKIGYCWLYVAC